MTRGERSDGSAAARRETDVVALASGGLDSAAMIGLSLEAGDTVHPLYVRQGFLWEEEEIAALRDFLAALAPGRAEGLRPLEVVALTAPSSFASRWALDGDRPVPAADSPDDAVFLPGRNLALLTQAAILAHGVGAGRVQLGVLATNPFPDATDEFFALFERAASTGLGIPIRVERPLGAMTKIDAIRAGERFPLGRTLSCIRTVGGRHCGACNKCEERRAAFARAGAADPTEYAAGGRTKAGGSEP